MPNIDQVQLPDGSQYNLKDNISGYVTAGYVDDAIDALTKADVGLGNVDNTSDLNKPVSTAQQTALNGKTDTTVIAPTEATTTASRRYEIGEQFILNGVLYTATAVITSGDTIIVNTNCVLSENITEQLKDIDLSADNVSFDNTGTDLVSENVEDAIKEVNGKFGGVMSMSRLWVNSSPTASFSAQRITLSSSDYDFLMATATTGAGTGSAMSSFIAPKGNSIYCNMAIGNGSQLRSRAITYVDDTTFDVDTAYKNGTADTSLIVPQAIYGIKLI
jgi:hypothetical protein